MLSLKLKENDTVWFGLTGSLLIHGILFSLAGPTFIPRAQFSVRPSYQSVEVSIEEIKYSKDVPSGSDGTINASKKKESVNKVSAARSLVRIKANPDYFQNPAPEYPELARQMREEGLVLLQVKVDRTGMPVNIDIVGSSGHRLLDQAALKAVSHWKFQAGRIGEISIESTVIVPVRFRLVKNGR